MRSIWSFVAFFVLLQAQPPSEIRPYVEFLRDSRQTHDAAEYLAELLDRVDVVVLAEGGSHNEVRHFEYLGRLLADEAIAGKVGYVFTETGTRNLQPHLDAFMAEPEENLSHLLHIEQNYRSGYEDVGGWPLSGTLEFWRTLRAINRAGGTAQIHPIMADLEWDWGALEKASHLASDDDVYTFLSKTLPWLGARETFVQRLRANRASTRTPYAAIRSTLNESMLPFGRDEGMGDFIADHMEKVSGPRSKAIVIMNTRHAYNEVTLQVPGPTPGTSRDVVLKSVAGQLRRRMEAKGRRVATVMMSATGAKDGTVLPAQDGKWDAAFEVCGNRPLAFDFAGSPFDESFDYHGEAGGGQTDKSYSAFFDGMLFWGPLDAHLERGASTVPAYFSPEFMTELTRRIAARDGVGFAEAKAAAERYRAENTFERRPVEFENPEFFRSITQWQ